MEFNNEYELLQEIYRGARMGEESIRLLLPRWTTPGSAPTYRPSAVNISPPPPMRNSR